MRTEYWDATHHCNAYRINPEQPIEFSSDDGEPNGTAGLPILNQLKSANLVDVGAIVIRYFGGTKLGKAGLIEAYGNSTLEVIESALLQTIKLVQYFDVTYPYNQENLINKLVLNYGLYEQEAAYTDEVSKTFACELAKSPQLAKELQTYAHLNIAFETGRKTYINAD